MMLAFGGFARLGFADESNSIRWDSVGHGGCTGGNWFKIGTAQNLDEAKSLMLAHSECSAPGSMLFYSDYSYSESWSVRCALSGHHEDCTENNKNWKEYILRPVRWDSVGHGGCTGGNWFKIGTAQSLDQAKELMLAHPECSKSDSMLFYSDYSYDGSWAVRCALSDHHRDCTENNTNWKEYILRREYEIEWEENGYGGCTHGEWFKIGTANSLEEAKMLMFKHPECYKPDSMLFYSDYSYAESWSVRCALSGDHENCTENNPNWREYIIRSKGGVNSAERGFKVTSGQNYCEVDKNGCVHDGADHYANHENCEFTFTGDAVLYAVEFDIEYNSSCSWDSLEVEGKGKFCGSAFAPLLVTGTTKFTFDTDYSVTRRGFMLCVQSWN